MSVAPGSRVKIAFTATYPDGALFDTSSRVVAAEHGLDTTAKRFRPIALEVGAEPTLPSLEEALVGLSVGDEATVEVPHEELTFAYDRADFEEMVDGPAEPGRQVHAATGLLGEVTAVTDDTVTVDVDPDRAGQPVTFDVEVLAVD